jgi:hypothetical protein
MWLLCPVNREVAITFQRCDVPGHGSGGNIKVPGQRLLSDIRMIIQRQEQACVEGDQLRRETEMLTVLHRKPSSMTMLCGKAHHSTW